MLAEIEQMSMNTNMHQVTLREKALLKTYLQVDMNEFFQQKMDTDLFNGVDEASKAKFIGNFFHFVKCRFNDCNLLQTKAKLNMRQEVQEAAKAESSIKSKVKAAAQKKPITAAKPPADKKLIQLSADISSPTIAEVNAHELALDLADWGTGHGHHTPAASENDKAYVQLVSDVEANRKAKMVTNGFADVQKELDAEKQEELIHPSQLSENKKDAEP